MKKIKLQVLEPDLWKCACGGYYANDAIKHTKEYCYNKNSAIRVEHKTLNLLSEAKK